MAKRFKDYLNNPQYQRAYNRTYARTGNHQERLVIYLENESDRHFWEPIIRSVLPQQKLLFRRAMSENQECGKRPVSGKSSLRRFMSSHWNNCLVLVDADFDIVAPKHSLIAQHIARSCNVVHTQGHSRESLERCAGNMERLLKKIYYFKHHKYKITPFLQNYSRRIYPLLTRYLEAINQHQLDEAQWPERKFCQKLIPERPDRLYFNNDWRGFEHRLKQLNKQLDRYLGKRHSINPTYQAHLHHIGLTEKTAYQFIRGHQLEDGIIRPTLKAIKHQIQEEAIADVEAQFIQAGDESPQLINKRREIINHFKNFDIDTLFALYLHDRDDALYQSIIKQLEHINTQFLSQPI